MQTFDSFKQLMAIKRYSSSTITAYIGLLRSFQAFLANKQTIEQLETPSLLNHIIRFVAQKQYAYASHKQLISAISLYLKELHQRSINVTPVYPTRKPHPLPAILAVSEVKALLHSLTNLKHRTMLTTIYALGLRSGELINLKVADIDGERNVVHIKNAKGQKDRVLPLSDKLRDQLRIYYTQYQP